MAVGFTVIGAVATIAANFNQATRDGPSFVSLVGFYFLGGICGGLVLGLLRPLTQFKMGAMFVGTAIIAITFALLEYMFVATDGWHTVDTIMVGVFSLIVGPVGTLMFSQVRSKGGEGSSDVSADQ